MNNPADSPLAGLDPAKAADSLLAALGQRPPAVPLTPRGVRKVNGSAMQDDQLEQRKERDMPRGIPGSGPKKDEKPKRKYTRRATNGADGDPVLELLIEAGKHLHATVVDQVEVGDNDEFKRALKGFELAAKIHAAAKA